ncbi:MAG: Ppx/GppA family phosphatase [Acetobacteraceae bacterium]|nr:Ppx/GppA family phosphatase [Acetobacteraceae bacterium]
MNAGPERSPAPVAAGDPGAERHYAVVDIGSNSVRLVVYEQLGRAPLPRFNEKSMCRLGEGLEESGVIAADAFARTLEAMRRFRAVAEAMDVGCIDVLATEAMRRASNGADLVRAIRAEAGFDVRVLSGAEEAHFASLGVVVGFHRPTGVVGDMGGGSVELAEVTDGQVGADTHSLPLGALPVQFLLARDGLDAKRRIDAKLKEALPGERTTPVFYAVGGGWRALARVHMASVDAPVPVVHGYRVDARELRAFAKSILRMPEGKIASLPGLPSRRGRTLAASALVMDRVVKRIAPEQVVFSALGVREGWLYHRLGSAEQKQDPLIVGVRAIGQTFARVPRFADALVRWTDDLLPAETQGERRLRVAACALSDIAWRDDAGIRAGESFRRLLEAPFIGLDHAGRAFIAAIVHARYAGSPSDPVLSPATRLLPPELCRRALIIGRAMLLGYRLSGSVPEILASARLRVGGGVVRLEVGKAARVPDSEVVANRLNLVASAAGAKRTEIVETA